ncbi:MAG: hypothetical protein HY855_08390 [Burkholderiales bacterium]|nr:hypothetical protein [Burkholderiales bacterium]
MIKRDQDRSLDDMLAGPVFIGQGNTAVDAVTHLSNLSERMLDSVVIHRHELVYWCKLLDPKPSDPRRRWGAGCAAPLWAGCRATCPHLSTAGQS